MLDRIVELANAHDVTTAAFEALLSQEFLARVSVFHRQAKHVTEVINRLLVVVQGEETHHIELMMILIAPDPKWVLAQ